MMSVLREYLRRLWGALRRNPTAHDLEGELRFHLEQAEAELRGKGYSPAEAARMARVRLGGFPQAMEALRDQRGLPWLDDLRVGLRVGLRGLARRAGFTATAALTLSIGIGATTAVATVTNALLFQPLPVPNPDELVVVAQLDEHTSEFPHGLSYPEYLDYRERNDVFDDLAAQSLAGPLLSVGGRPAERVWIEYVSDNYFDVLQVAAARGRTFLPGEGSRPGDAPFVVLTHRAWQTRFGGDPAVLGRVVRLGPANMTVIGITPETFTGTRGVVPVELFVPATAGVLIEPGWTELLTNRLPERFVLTGRLRPDVTVGEAAAQLDVLAAALAAEHPDASRHTELYVVAERHARPEPMASRHARPLMGVVMGLALVLLVAIANVGTLLVGRGVARRQEMALRAGLGATRWRLVRQLVTESVLLALMAGAGGGIVALWAADLVIATFAMATGVGQLNVGPSVDWRVFGFTATVAIGAGLLTGLAPALRSTRFGLSSAIAAGGRGFSGGAAGRRLTNGLVVIQVAVSMVLLVCGGLFVQSGRNAGSIDFGFRTDDLLVLSVDPLAQGYDREQARALYREIVDGVVALPGVRSASWARRAPLLPGGSSGSVFTLDGGTAPEPEAAIVAVNNVDPHFFDTVGIPVIQGRGFREEDAAGNRQVAVVSERAARQFWPGQDVIGRRIVNADTGGAPFEVIGVARDAHLSQSPFRPAALRSLSVRSPPHGIGHPARAHGRTGERLDLDGHGEHWRARPNPGDPGCQQHGRRGALDAIAGDRACRRHGHRVVRGARPASRCGRTLWCRVTCGSPTEAGVRYSHCPRRDGGCDHRARARSRRSTHDAWPGAWRGRGRRRRATHGRLSRRGQSERPGRVCRRRPPAGGRGSARLSRAVKARGEGRPARDAAG